MVIRECVIPVLSCSLLALGGAGCLSPSFHNSTGGSAGIVSVFMSHAAPHTRVLGFVLVC